jgi:hypothetical protein
MTTGRATAYAFLGTLAVAFVFSCVGALQWVGPHPLEDRSGGRPGVALGFGITAVVLATVAQVLFYRYPADAQTRRRFPPLKLGMARVIGWWLTFMALSPLLLAWSWIAR